MSTVVDAIAPGVAGFGAALVFFSVFPMTDGGVLTRRLDAIATSDDDPDVVELQRPLFERIALPIISSVGKVLLRTTPEQQVDVLRRKLQLVGSSMPPEQMMALKLVAMFGMGAFGIVLNLFVVKAAPPAAYAIPVGLLALGYLMPERSVTTKLRKRAKEIQKALPSALDLLTISMEAGLSLDAAMSRVAEEDPGVLGGEFARTLSEIRLGRSRQDALSALAARNDVEGLTDVIQGIAQAEPLGVSLAVVMRVKSEDLRRQRRQRAEEQGAKAPVKMLIPMVGCIFPTIFIVLLGPAVLQVTGQK